MEEKLEIINLTKNNAIEKIIESLKIYGFAVLKNHGIEKNLIKENFNSWNSFFNSEEKHNYAYDGIEYYGYFSFDNVEIPLGATKRDYKEFAHFYHGHYPFIVEKTHSSLFEKTSDIFYDILDKLEKELPKNVTNYFDKPLVDMIKGNKMNCLRVNHYPQITKSMNKIRAEAHTDVSFMTLLITDKESGLEVLTKTNKWIPIPAEENCIVINIGDMLEELTKGYFKSTYHRVVNPESDDNVSRYSMPLFVYVHHHLKLNDNQTTEQFLEVKRKEFGFKV